MAFMEAASEGVVFYNEQHILDCNPAFERLLGRTRESLVGTSALHLFLAKDHEVASRHMFLGLSNSYLARLPRPDGSRINVEIAGRLSKYAGQSCWVATVHDTSNMAAVTHSLVRSQSRYRSLVENADQVIMFVQDRKVAYANPAAARFFKTDAAKMHGTESVFLIHPEDRALALARRKAMLEGDPDRSVMLRTIAPPTEHLQADTVVSWVRFYGSLVEWEERMATLIFMTDLTVQHETQERMRKALAQEKELGDLKTRFVSMASHEFRTPLSTIQTSSELLEHYSERLSPRERSEALTDIQRSVQRMQAMMDNFLAFGRTSESAMYCNPQPVQVMAVVRDVVHEILAADGQQHMVQIDVNPSVNEDCLLHLDQMLLRQMLGNLLGNACKYSAFGQPVHLQISQLQATGAEQGDWLRMLVSDQGIGIPASDLPLLFESFHRAANAVNLPGSGLGLAIVDRAVRAHGGRVSVSSIEGEGSEFELLLPWVIAE